MIKEIKIGILLFLPLYLPLQAQNTKTYDYFHPEYEDHVRPKKQTDKGDNDNWLYFSDIALERGIYIPTDNNTMNSGSITSLYGSRFFTDKWGARSGFSYITNLEGGTPYLKIPFLFALRSQTVHLGEGPHWVDFDNFAEFLAAALVHIIPSRYELNVGTSLGYIFPEPASTYSVQNGSNVLLETYEIRSRFASSLDANLRLGFQFWRIGLNANFGINYLWTKNFTCKEFFPTEEQSHPAWFANLSAGASFRF